MPTKTDFDIFGNLKIYSKLNWVKVFCKNNSKAGDVKRSLSNERRSVGVELSYGSGRERMVRAC